MEEPQPRTFTASWNIEDIQNYEVERDRALRNLRPFYKGKVRTVKQRNKSRWINWYAKLHNDRVLRHREMKQLERSWLQTAANEIRKEIDNEILESIVNMLKPK